MRGMFRQNLISQYKHLKKWMENMSIRTEKQKQDRSKAWDIAQKIALGKIVLEKDIQDVKIEVEKYLFYIQKNCWLELNKI
jgi:hypothetical protein